MSTPYQRRSAAIMLATALLLAPVLLIAQEKSAAQAESKKAASEQKKEEKGKAPGEHKREKAAGEQKDKKEKTPAKTESKKQPAEQQATNEALQRQVKQLEQENGKLEQFIKDRDALQKGGVQVLRQMTPGEARILAELDQPTVLEFIETPLPDVADFLKDFHKIEIQVDTRALDDSGVGTDTPVTLNLRGVKLRSALELLLARLNLDWIIDHEVLLITTPEAARKHREVWAYAVPNLSEEQAAKLAAVLETVLGQAERQRVFAPVAPSPYPSGAGESSGKEATIVPYGSLLLVRGTQRTHREVERVLNQIHLASKLKAEAASVPEPMDVSTEPPKPAP